MILNLKVYYHQFNYNIKMQNHKDSQMNIAKPEKQFIKIQLQKGQAPNSNSDPQQNGQGQAIFSTTTINRITGGVILMFVLLILWPYGWGSQIRLITPNTLPINPTSVIIYSQFFILTAIFTVIGFGLVFFYYKNTATAIFTSLFVVSFTILLSPLIQKFWFNVFLSDFVGREFVDNRSPNRFLYFSLGGKIINLDFYYIRTALANSISQLVCYLIVFGKLNLKQITVNTILYNIAWNLNHFLCIFVQGHSNDLRIFDDYQISNVYLFATCYGLMLTVINPQIIEARKEIQVVKKAYHVFALVGTFFIFLSFCATTLLFSLKFEPAQLEFTRSYLWPEAFISIFFALSGSIIFNYAFSILLKDKIGFKESLVGTITGAIMYGSIAGTSINFGTALTIGLASGLFSAIYYYKVQVFINKNYIYDSLGGFIFLVVSFIGSFMIAPIVLRAYYNHDWVLPTFQDSNLDRVGRVFRTDSGTFGFMLWYVGISVGVGLVSGFIVGLISKCLSYDKYKSFSDKEIFAPHFGLRVQQHENQEEA